MADKAETTDDKELTPDSHVTDFRGFATHDGERQESEKVAEETEKPTPKAKSETDDDADDAKHRSAQQRINKAVGKQRAAERKANEAEQRYRDLEARLAKIEGQTESLTKNDNADTVDPDAPKPGAYEYGELDPRFIKDLARYEARKEFAEQTSKAKKDQPSDEDRQRQEVEQAFADFADKGAEKYDDFYDVVIEPAENNEYELTPLMAQMILESDVGIDVAYALASDYKEAKRVARLSHAKQAVWFGRKEAELSPESPGADQDEGAKEKTPATRQSNVTKAPAPIPDKVRGSGGQQQTSPDTTNFSEFERMATAKQ